MSKLTIAEKATAYIKLRDYEKAAEAEFDASMQKVKDAKLKLEADFLAHLNETGANSLSCDGGTIYKNTQMTATVENRDAFRDYVVEQNLWEAMDIRANKTFVKEFMSETGQVPPGLKITQLATVNVRRSK